MSEAGKGADFVRDLGEAARQNPLSAALIGMGVVWLFTGGRSSGGASASVAGASTEFARRTGRMTDAAGDAFEASRSSVRSAVDTAVDTIGNSVNSATRTLRDSGAAAMESASRFGRQQVNAASDFARAVPESSNQIFGTVRTSLGDIFEAQPLALGAIGLAIGAGIAAALPRTDVETDYLGETSEALKDKAVEYVSDQTDRAATVAERVIGVVTDEARRQGFTSDGIKSVAGDVKDKVGRVADAAGKSLADRLKSVSPE